MQTTAQQVYSICRAMPSASAALSAFKQKLASGTVSNASRGSFLVVTVLLPSEQENVRLWAVNGVVDPAAALLDADSAPLLLAQQAVLRDVLGDVLGQNHMAAGVASKNGE